MRPRNQIACPQCGSKHPRLSRWRSREEKHQHPDFLPRRCIECDHRFLAPARPAGRARAWLVAAAAALSGLTAFIIFAAFIAGEPSHEADQFDLNLEPVVGPSIVAPRTLKAAEEGDANAQFKVGKNLILDSAEDHSKALEAVHWLQQAAANGSTAAMVQLGRMYQSGIGTLQNFDTASAWILKAAESGDAEGMLELGRLYRGGVGLKQDLILAYVWFNRAAAKLNMAAVHERDGVKRRLNAEQLKTAQQLSLEVLADESVGPASSE